MRCVRSGDHGASSGCWVIRSRSVCSTTGSIIGARLEGAVLIIDDVISAGTSVRESLTHIAAGGARAAGVVIALDRMERGTGAVSAVEEVRNQMGLPVVSIANLDDIVDYLSNDPGMAASLAAVEKYRALYGSR
jgi:orotate phosphoribosyltransferase